MKAIYFENMRNREKFLCKNLKDVQVIDGTEYLRVVRHGPQHECLIKKDLLRKIKETN
jgi:hypothetical protein